MSAPQSVADTQLGFTHSELLILRQQQQVLAQQRSHQGGVADRGRGTSRHSQPSSRAASAASSQGVPQRVVLDPRSLQSLHTHFDSLMRTIQNRINDLDDAMHRSVQHSSERASHSIQHADAEIERVRRVLREIDALEDYFENVKRIRDVIKRLRTRVDAANDRLERSRPTNQGDSRGHGSSGRHDRERDRHRR